MAVIFKLHSMTVTLLNKYKGFYKGRQRHTTVAHLPLRCDAEVNKCFFWCGWLVTNNAEVKERLLDIVVGISDSMRMTHGMKLANCCSIFHQQETALTKTNKDFKCGAKTMSVHPVKLQTHTCKQLTAIAQCNIRSDVLSGVGTERKTLLVSCWYLVSCWTSCLWLSWHYWALGNVGKPGWERQYWSHYQYWFHFISVTNEYLEVLEVMLWSV